MSSACLCHTNEWCFYCEMYVPLEKKNEALAQALRDVRNAVWDDYVPAKLSAEVDRVVKKALAENTVPRF